ncbi:MAG: hypothetical protein F6K54_22935 [Okeania sp. SIO3B5]|uniref:hypothetical protein n=1 Tax=Okeania sp. SIO3B5 TaxID=2607811 RepID=UPI0013FF73D6|nr:hypothetical protein [Okeania sp. SIO3B5]NEO55670.1 hypothetical protein [Okeania sp. SIO3B5]
MVERVWGDGEMGRWGDGEIGRLGDWEIGGLGVWEKLKNIYLHHYHAGLPMNEPSISLTSTAFLNKELKHKNKELKLSTKGNKADNAVPTIGG